MTLEKLIEKSNPTTRDLINTLLDFVDEQDLSEELINYLEVNSDMPQEDIEDLVGSGLQ